MTIATSVTTQTGERVREPERARKLLDELREKIGIRELRSGHWFTRLVTIYLRHYDMQRQAGGAGLANVTDVASRAQSMIRRACVGSTLTGATTATLSTGATVTMAETQWITGLAAVPFVGVAITGEMILRALINLKMTCDLAELYGVRLDPNDPTEIMRLYALAFHTEENEDRDDPGRSLVERLIRLEGHEAAGAIGLKMLGESVIRNGVPFAGIAVSSLTNWQQTRNVGETVRRYLRLRRALNEAISAVERHWSESFDLLVESVWFVFIAKGALTQEEAAVLGYLVRRRAKDGSPTLTTRFVRDESAWLRRLGETPANARLAVLRVLEIAACADKTVPPVEEAVLQRAAQALNCPFEHSQLDAMLRQFGTSEALAAASIVEATA